MQNALIEAERIDERLERRAGRAACQRAVHLARQIAVEIIAGADERLDAHVARVDEDRGRIADAAPAIAHDVAADLALERMLQIEIERRRDARVRARA